MSIQALKNLLQGYISSNPSSVVSQETDVGALAQTQYTARIFDAATAGTAQTETPIGVVQDAGQVKAIYVQVPVAVTASDTDKATITIAKRTAAGASSATIATLVTNVAQGNLVAQAAYSLTLTAANTRLAAGEVLTVAVAKAGSGVALTAATSEGKVTVVYEKGST
jgi:hypothetical protein